MYSQFFIRAKIRKISKIYLGIVLFYSCKIQSLLHGHVNIMWYIFYDPNGYIRTTKICVYFFARIKVLPRWAKMHLNKILLIKTEFFK